MAATCTNYNPATKKGKYVVGTVDELSQLPTTTTYGNGELAHHSPCSNGSECIVLNPSLMVYFLDGSTNTWVKRG